MALLLVVVATVSVQAKNKQEKNVYAFAYGTCLSDSTVYLSAISQLDSATVEKKTEFLHNRSLYSYQFKVYLEHVYKKTYTCAVLYATSKDKLEKKYVKLRRHLNKSKDFRYIEVPVTDFKFINPDSVPPITQ